MLDLPSRELEGEQFHPGDRVRCLILDVRDSSSQIKIVLSRSHPDFIRRLFEAEVPYVVFEKLKREMPKEKLTKALAYIVLKPDEGKLVLKAPDLGFEEDAPEADVREREHGHDEQRLEQDQDEERRQAPGKR